MTTVPTRCTLLQEFFENSVERYPDAPAIDLLGITESYHALEQRANRIAHYLLNQGVGPNQRVAVVLEKDVHLYGAILGILKSGGCWSPLGVHYPRQRLRLLIEQLAPRVVIVSPAVLETILAIRRETSIPFAILLLGDDRSGPEHDCEAQLAILPANRPTLREQNGDDLAYIIFTSGSTGEPKGVMAYHRNICAFLNLCSPFFALPPGLRFAHFSEITFDPSLFDMFYCWATGGTLVPNHKRSYRINPGLFMEEARVDVLFTVPSVINAMQRSGQMGSPALATVRHLILTGEPVPATLVNAWYRAYPECRVYNFYGTTETVIISHWCRFVLPLDPNQRPPVGHLLPGLHMMLLDGNREVSSGEIGESVVYGTQISPGYWRNNAENAARFITNPLHPELPQKVYRTGDCLRQRPDGQYEFVTRSDLQVKVRGHRVEPHEVESVLLQSVGIKEVAVVLVTPSEAMETAYLAAFIVGDPTLDTHSLNAFLASKLPAYMVPSQFVFLDAMPLNANGKVDRLLLAKRLLNQYGNPQP